MLIHPPLPLCVCLCYRTSWIAMECILSIWALRTPLTLMVCCSSTATPWVNPKTHTATIPRARSSSWRAYKCKCSRLTSDAPWVFYSLTQQAFSFSIQGSARAVDLSLCAANTAPARQRLITGCDLKDNEDIVRSSLQQLHASRFVAFVYRNENQSRR